MRTFLENKSEQLRRFFFCMRLYGVANAVKMTWRAESSDSRRTLKFRIPGGDILPFTFRGKLDFGVLSHFWKEGYYISDTPADRITKIMDCGANIGDETARFRLHYPEARIIAIEPNRENFSILNESFFKDRLVEPVHGAVWSHDTQLNLVQPRNGNPESSRVTESENLTEPVPAYSIPTLMSRAGWKEIDILKLDIEGAENQLFKTGCEDWIEKINVLIFEAPDSDCRGTTQLIFSRLSRISFKVHACGENLILVRETKPWEFQRISGVKTP